MKSLVALATLLIVLLILLFEAERTSPGPLSAVHLQDPILKDRRSCAKCHGIGEQSLADACLKCHGIISDQLAANSGLHGNLEEPLALDCSPCHGEHFGESFAPVRAASFVLAGIPSREEYDHRDFDWTLVGRHLDQDCEACHENALVEVLPVGETRFIGLSQTCTTCHEDAHEGFYGSNCGECHGQATEFELASNFDHHSDFPLLGAHKRVACFDCHSPDTEHAVGELLGEVRSVSLPENARQSCADCHENSHSERFLAGVARIVDRPSDQACTRCHRAAHDTFRGDHGPMTDRLHANSGFPLDGQHADLTCADCHADFGNLDADERYFAQAYPGRNRESCGDCHEDPHEGYYGKNCTDCHGLKTPFAEVENFEHHPDYPLLGAHSKVACTECHEAETRHSVRLLLDSSLANSNPLVVRDSCQDCHESPHADNFLTGVAAEFDATVEDSCSTCHLTLHESFRGNQARLTPELHANSGFALDAPHADQDCADCHLDFGSAPAPENYFTLAFPGRDRETCQQCHEDPHSNQFAEGPFGIGCTECHAPTKFTPPQFGIDHHARTSFPLNGSHTAVSCVKCHDPETEHLYSEAPVECAACHESPHGDRFDREGLPLLLDERQGCARCHTTQAFGDISSERFDHELWTQFKLEGKHAATDCVSCHLPSTAPLVGAENFSPANGNQCANCHNDVHFGQFIVTDQNDCSRCHEAVQESFVASAFDHQRDSRFTLDEMHDQLDCGVCHQAYDLPDGRQVTRYLPLGIECVDCHDPGSLEK